VSERNPRVSQTLTPPVVAHPTQGRTAVARGLAEVAETAIGVRQQQIAGQMSDELWNAHEEFVADHAAAMDEADPLMDLNTGDRTAVQQFMDIQARLEAAQAQGTAPVTELKMRQERIMREYMRRYPRLVPLFQQAANGVLGYSPIGAEIQHLSAQRQARQSEVEAVYNRIIKAADSAGVNPMLQITHPEQYWNEAIGALSAVERNAKLDRDLRAMDTVAGLNKHDARRMIRQNQGGIASGVWQESINPIIQEALQIHATMDPTARGSAAASGMFDSLRHRLNESKSQFVTEFYNEYFVNSDMSPAELEAELKPVLDVYDYAIQNLSDANLMEKANQLVKVQESEFFLKYPEVQQLNLMADILNSHAVASAIQVNRQLGTDMARLINGILSQTLGGTAPAGTHRVPPAMTPQGRVNPAASEGNLPAISAYESPEEALAAFDVHWAQMNAAYQYSRDATDPLEQDKGKITAAVMATQFANTYIDHHREMNKLMPRDVVDQYVNFLADPNTLSVWQEDMRNPIAGVDRRRIAQAVGIMLRSEQGQAARDMRRVVTDNMAKEHVGVLGDRTLLAQIVSPRWDPVTNRPFYELDEEVWDGLSTYNKGYKQKRDLKAALEALNNSPEIAYLGRLAMASAHIAGSTRYAQAMDEEVLRILGFSVE
jgi:hypothetical protein